MQYTVELRQFGVLFSSIDVRDSGGNLVESFEFSPGNAADTLAAIAFARRWYRLAASETANHGAANADADALHTIPIEHDARPG